MTYKFVLSLNYMEVSDKFYSLSLSFFQQPSDVEPRKAEKKN